MIESTYKEEGSNQEPENEQISKIEEKSLSVDELGKIIAELLNPIDEQERDRHLDFCRRVKPDSEEIKKLVESGYNVPEFRLSYEIIRVLREESENITPRKRRTRKHRKTSSEPAADGEEQTVKIRKKRGRQPYDISGRRKRTSSGGRNSGGSVGGYPLSMNTSPSSADFSRHFSSLPPPPSAALIDIDDVVAGELDAELTHLVMAHNQETQAKSQALMVAAQQYYNGQDNKQVNLGRWSTEDHEKFVEGLRLFGKDWKKIEEFIGTRSGSQIRSHAQKFFRRSVGPDSATDDNNYHNIASASPGDRAAFFKKKNNLSYRGSPSDEINFLPSVYSNMPEPMNDHRINEDSERSNSLDNINNYNNEQNLSNYDMMAAHNNMTDQPPYNMPYSANFPFFHPGFLFPTGGNHPMNVFNNPYNSAFTYNNNNSKNISH